MRQRIPVDHWDRKGRELLGQTRRLLEVEARHIHIPSEVLADFLPCLSELPALAAPSAYVSIREHT